MLKNEIWTPKQIVKKNSKKMANSDGLKRCLACLKGHRSRHRSRFDKNLQYSDTKRAKQLKTVVETK